MNPTSFRFIVFLAFFLVGVFFTGSASAQDPGELYKTHCARCHGETGKGDGPAAIMHRPLPRDFTTGRYKFRSTPLFTLPLVEDVERVITEGVWRTSMPPYEGLLSDEEIRSLAKYVLEMSRDSGLEDGKDQAIERAEELDFVTVAPARLAKGKKLYEYNKCFSCHGHNGRGLGDLTGGLRDENGFWISPADLTDTLSYGGGSNPSDIYMRLLTAMDLSPMLNYSELLDKESAEDLALYVRSLQMDPNQRTLIAPGEWQDALPAKVRGEYLFRAMSCSLCHNSYDESGRYYPHLYLAGGIEIRLPGLGTFPTRNLTSHPQDGLGDWTEEEIVKSITTGYARNRRLEAFAMPWVFFSYLKPEDASDVAVHIKTLSPIQNSIPDRQFDPIWKSLWIRMRQLFGFEYGRLEYLPFNAGVRHEERAAEEP